MDLSVSIAGVRFPVCLMNASGARCVTREELEGLGASRSGAIVTKSMTREPRVGNPEPRYFHFPGGSLNSMGLPNLGYAAYAAIIPELRRFGKPIVASIAGFQLEDFVEGVRHMNEAKPDVLEINLSCPNIPGKPQIGYDFEDSERLLSAVKEQTDLPVGVKLPPYFDPVHHEAMARVLERVGVSFVTVINSVGNALVVDPHKESVVLKPKGGFGGLGGSVIKPVALANVRAFWKLLGDRIPVIGTGGIQTGTDAFEHLLCGASAVQVGTVLVEENVGVFDRIEKELRECLAEKGYNTVLSCRGRLREL